MKTSELQGAALDWAVATIEGHDYWRDGKWTADVFTPSTDWAQGGPIIEREMLMVQPELGKKGAGNAWYAVAMTPHDSYGPTPLAAAMLCFVASKLGDEVEIPEELR